MTPGKKIVELREARDMNQTELAQALEINRSVLNRIEQGTRPIRDDELKKLADYFHVTTDELLGRDAPAPGYYLDEETARRNKLIEENPIFNQYLSLSPKGQEKADDIIRLIAQDEEYNDMA